MATADVILLSSSPPKLFARSPTPALMSSSPSLPSPSALLRPSLDKPKVFKSTGHTRDGFPGFQTVTTLLKQSVGKETVPLSQTEDRTEVKKHASREASAPREDAGKVKKRTSKTDGEAKPRKPGKRKSKDQSQTMSSARILDGKATKAGQKFKGKTVDSEGLPEATKFLEGEDLLLDEATKRRLEWTPPKESSKGLQNSDDSPHKSPSPSCNGSFGELFSTFGFKDDSRESFGSLPQRERDRAPTKRRRVELLESTTNLVSVPSAKITKELAPKETTKTSDKRSKSPPKKSTTITARATSNYFGDTEIDKPSPLLKYLTSEADRSDTTMKPPAGKRTKVKKTLSAQKSRNPKVSVPDAIVLSPQSALKSFKDQDLVFGTASQLAMDESAVLTRDAQLALKASESCSTSESSFHVIENENMTPASASSSFTSRFAASKSLWSVAARDCDGSLMDADTVNPVESPNIKEALSKFEPSQGQAVSTVSEGPESGKGGWMHIENDGETPRPKANGRDISADQYVLQWEQAQSTAQVLHSTDSEQSVLGDDELSAGIATEVSRGQGPVKPAYVGFTTAQLAQQISSYGFKPTKSRDAMIALLERCWDDQIRSSSQVVPLVADSLAKSIQVSTTRSSLRDLCDQAAVSRSTHSAISTVTVALRGIHASTSNPQPEAIPSDPRPKKPRGRPRKDATTSSQANPSPKKSLTKSKAKAPKSTALPLTPRQKSRKRTAPLPSTRTLANDDGDDIEDSTEEASPTPTPPRRRRISPSQTTTNTPPSTLPLVLSSSTSSPTPAQPVDLSSQITRAIKSQPRSLNAQKQPTWHQKILMYDPIVLEDLAAWLNTEGLALVDEDREVSAADVREWCEGRGVCCLWKGGWRGSGRVG